MKNLKMIIILITVLFLLVISYFFIGSAPKPEKIVWGIVFSQKHSNDLGLNWKENYLALLDDLSVKEIKLLTHWDLIEKKPKEYDFNDLDWQIEEAQKREVNILLVVGLKSGRWPECHIPEWARKLALEELEEKVLRLTEKIILRYQNYSVIWAWQVENEPFFSFGDCPKIRYDFVKQEAKMVKNLDQKNRPIVITDSGEGSFWFKVSQLADITGFTIYRKVWANKLKFYFSYENILPPVFYWRKALIIQKFFGNEVVCTELQAEPWTSDQLYGVSLEEQSKTMDLEQFKQNIEFARKTGIKRFYLWGAEWWYWLKNKHNQNEIWDEAKTLFNQT